MKIVLNNKEVKSFKEFLVEYAYSCVESLESINSEESLEMLAGLEGKSGEELASCIMNEVDLSPVVVFNKVDEDCYEVEVSMDVLVAYNNYIGSTIKALRPYSNKLACILMSHVEKLRELASKANKMSFGLTEKLVKGLFVMVGLEDLYAELRELCMELKADEETIQGIKASYNSIYDVIKEVAEKSSNK